MCFLRLLKSKAHPQRNGRPRLTLVRSISLACTRTRTVHLSSLTQTTTLASTSEVLGMRRMMSMIPFARSSDALSRELRHKLETATRRVCDQSCDLTQARVPLAACLTAV